jgi:hypothetical protein
MKTKTLSAVGVFGRRTAMKPAGADNLFVAAAVPL